MVFLALLEYGLILWIKCQRKHGFVPISPSSENEDSDNTKHTASKASNAIFHNTKKKNRMDIISKNTIRISNTTAVIRNLGSFDVKIIDKISIILFPLSFVVFNVLYWCTFL